VDGNLDDSIWQERFFDDQGRMGQIAGAPWRDDDRMLLRRIPQGLVIGLTVPQPLGKVVGIRMSLLQEFGVPAKNSAYCLVTDQPGLKPDSKCIAGGREIPWKSDWRIAFNRTQAQWQAEVLIPVKQLRREARPDPGTTWRLNCAVVDWQDRSHPKTLYQWGYPDVTKALHGMLLKFGLPNNEN